MTLRRLARICVVLFALSTAFPVASGVLNSSDPPRWLGIADVSVAGILCGAAITLATRGRGTVADRHRLIAFRATQVIVGVVPVLIAAYFVAGTRVNWTVLVLGLAWRGWLLLYTLPFLAAGLSAGEPRGVGPNPVDGPNVG
jgi:hypothetical protein